MFKLDKRIAHLQAKLGTAKRTPLMERLTTTRTRQIVQYLRALCSGDLYNAIDRYKTQGFATERYRKENYRRKS